MEKTLSPLESYGFTPCHPATTRNALGRAFFAENKLFTGTYWFFEGNGFTVATHDFFIKKDLVMNHHPRIPKTANLTSSYLVSAKGEWFTPYQDLRSGSVLIAKGSCENIRFFLRGGYPYRSISLHFTQSMLEKYMPETFQLKYDAWFQTLMDCRLHTIKPLESLAKDICDCTFDQVAAKVYFEAKAKEWLSILLHTVHSSTINTKPPREDHDRILLVAQFIENHYNQALPQKLLEEIALMSGTKLKNTFKRTFHMTITEYTQQKRINVAEELLLSTNLSLHDVAQSVGYASVSRFSVLFKRLRGMTPFQFRHLRHQTNPVQPK